MEEIIRKGKNIFEAAEAFEIKSEETGVEFENNKLKNIFQEESKGVALRAVYQGKIGFSTSTKENDGENLLSRAKEVSLFGSPYNFEFSADQGMGNVNNYVEETIGYPVEAMLEIGNELTAAIMEFDPSILSFVRVGRGLYHTRIVNSQGIDKEYKKTNFTVSVGGEKTEEGNFLHVYDYSSKPRLLQGSEITDLKKYVIESFKIAQKNLTCESGKYKVIFSPHAVYELLVPFMVCANGKSVQKKISPLRDKLDTAIFDSRITLEDHGLLADATGSCPFDDEGVPTRVRAMVENGVLKSFYHNLTTAKELNQAPTGNGFRSAGSHRGVESLPSPSATNVILKGGEKSIDQILSGVKQGIWVDQLMGTFTSNFLTGELRGNISLGYLVDRGEKVGRVKDVVIALNIFEALKDQIIAISKETSFRGSTSLPYILLDNISITAAQG